MFLFPRSFAAPLAALAVAALFILYDVLLTVGTP
jgi:hypothetical protein